MKLARLVCLFLFTLTFVARAQFTYTTNNGSITITGYNCPSSNMAVVIPATVNGLPVTSIGSYAFAYCSNLTSVIIPDSVSSLGSHAFSFCTGLTNGLTIPDSVTSIESGLFYFCFRLTNVTIGKSVTTIGNFAFENCTKLAAVYFRGNSPALGQYVFDLAPRAVVYYTPGTSGWGSSFGGRPTALWFLPNPLILTSHPDFGVQTNQFGFTISWATNKSVVVEAASNLLNPVWTPVSTNVLTGGTSYFSDPQWTNHPSRLYRLRAP